MPFLVSSPSFLKSFFPVLMILIDSLGGVWVGVLWIRESIKLLYSLRCGVMNDPMKRRTVLTLGQFQLQVQENNIKTVSFSRAWLHNNDRKSCTTLACLRNFLKFQFENSEIKNWNSEIEIENSNF